MVEPKNPAFLVPVEALSLIFRAKLCAALKKAGLLGQVPPTVWKKKWVVHCRPAGRGQKVLEYPGRYVFRVAITNSRLERIDNGEVTFRYRDNRSRCAKRHRHRVHPPISPARAAPWLCQGALLRDLERFLPPKHWIKRSLC